MNRRSTVNQTKIEMDELNSHFISIKNQDEDEPKVVYGKIKIYQLLANFENKENSSVVSNTIKSSSFVNLKRPNLQEIRNKAKFEKLKNRRKMCSQERPADDSEIIDEDDSHIEINKNYITTGKNLKTIDSINKSLKVKRPQFQDKGQESRNEKCRSPISRFLNNRHSSISLIWKQNSTKAKTLAIDAFYENSTIEHVLKQSVFGMTGVEKDLNKTSKMSTFDRNLSNSRTHDRSKSNVNQNRHFSIKHEPNNFDSIATFQKLMNNFPDIRWSSTEDYKLLDRESIDRRASELKKYMSSGRSNLQKSFNSKSSREAYRNPYKSQDVDRELQCVFSDSKIDISNHGNVTRTSIDLVQEPRVKTNNHDKRTSGVKMTSWDLNRVLPFQQVNQIPETPSMEFDPNECFDDDQLMLSAVTEEYIIEQDISK